MKQLITRIATLLILTTCWIKMANAIELPVCVNKKTSAWRTVANINKCNAKKEDAKILNSIGPAGPQGEKGEPGPVGPKGDKGEDGNAGGVNVYDANNQNLGVFINLNSIEGYGGSLEVFLPAPISAFARILCCNMTPMLTKIAMEGIFL